MGSIWEVDALNSYVGFEIRHLKISKLIGRFDRFEGKIEIPENSQTKFDNFNIEVDVDSINTGNSRRDVQLQEDSCLSSINFPNIIYSSSKFVPIDKEHFLVDGLLTIRNITNNVQFTGHLGGFAKDESNMKKMAIELTSIISRAAFNLKHTEEIKNNLSYNGDAVNIHMYLEFKLSKS